MDNLILTIKSVWGNSLQKISPERIKEYALSPTNETILLEVGLPLGNDLISFYDESMMKAYTQECDTFFIIGDDYGTQIGISLNMNEKDEIYSFDIQNELPKRFINSDISKLFQFLMLYQPLKTSLVESTDEEASSIIAEIKSEFNKIDLKALSNEDNWWSVVLKQHEEGMM